jgi:hypothetical protein
MSSFGKCIRMATVIFSSGLVVSHLVWSQGTTSGLPSDAKERARIVLSQPLPKLDGDHLKVVLVEVHYGPGEASSPRIIKGRSFEVGFECEAKLYRKEHPYGH